MDPIDCQNHIAQISAQISALEKHASRAHFCETSRLEYYEYLRDQIEQSCHSIINTKLIIPLAEHHPIVPKHP